MSIKWIGAVLIVMGCGGVGVALAASHRREEAELRRLIAALDFMQCELQYRMTALPELCRLTAGQSSGCVKTLFCNLAAELEDQISPDVYHCMHAALTKTKELTPKASSAARELGRTLGRFDLEGQLRGLEAARHNCRRELEQLESGRDARLRGYQTLGLCAGAALAILFL